MAYTIPSPPSILNLLLRLDLLQLIVQTPRAFYGMGQLNFPFTSEPKSQHAGSGPLSNGTLPDNKSRSPSTSEDSDTQTPLGRPRHRQTPMFETRHPDDFNLALENIRASGFGELSPRQKIVLDQMLNDFPWMATIPERQNDPRFTSILAHFGNWYPGLHPVLDGYGWPELYPEEVRHMLRFRAEPLTWILFGREDGFYFYYEETDDIHPAGKDLEQLMEDLYDNKYLLPEEDGGWPEPPAEQKRPEPPVLRF